MKLRNKITGEVGVINLKVYGDEAEYCYDSLETLYKEWEDYTPKEPLIKDEKIRKALRAWADANDEKEINVSGGCLATLFQGLHTKLDIELCCSWTRDGVYTLIELCGEEK